MGIEPLIHYLGQRREQISDFQSLLLVGLCGSLSPEYAIGDIVLYQECIYAPPSSPPQLRGCDRSLTAILHRNLQEKASLVRGLTSDRPIWSAQEKRHLGQRYGAGAVDMEGFAALDFLEGAGVAVAMLRVISDDCCHNLPDLNPAFRPDGSLAPFPLTLGLLRHPLAAARLVRGSLRGLEVLQQVTADLF